MSEPTQSSRALAVPPRLDVVTAGVFSIEGSPRARQYVDEHGRPTSYGGVHDSSDRLHEALMKERLDRIEAEKAAVRAKDEAMDAKAELERYKRSSWLDDRERKVSDRERQLGDEQRRIGEAPARPAPREVVVSQPRPPVRFVDDADDAMKRARDDYKRRSGGGR